MAETAAPKTKRPKRGRYEERIFPVALEQFAEVKSAGECQGPGIAWTMAGTEQTIFGKRRVAVREAEFSIRPFDQWGLELIADDLAGPSSRWTLFMRLNGNRQLKSGKYRQSRSDSQSNRNPAGVALDFPGEADKCGDEGSIELRDLRRLGSEIASFDAFISQRCVKDPLREVTGCIHYENTLLLDAERDLRDPRARLSEMQGGGSTNSASASHRAHDPSACTGSRSYLAVQAKSKHSLVGREHQRTFDHPKAKVSRGVGRDSHVLKVVLEQEAMPTPAQRRPAAETWDMAFRTSAPLAPGLYSSIGGYAKSNARMSFVANSSSCTVTAARVVVHELAPDQSAGLLTFEVQCGGNLEVLTGCARFAH